MELESAGSPAYVVAIVDGSGAPRLAPMIFSTPQPAREQAVRLAAARPPGERVAVVVREAEGRRALFSVFDPSVERRLHRQQEIVETAFAERDVPA